jgi:hypothetical protein
MKRENEVKKKCWHGRHEFAAVTGSIPQSPENAACADVVITARSLQKLLKQMNRITAAFVTWF